MNRFRYLVMITLCAITLLPYRVFADDAQVLPKGRGMIRIRGLHTVYDERFDPDGDREPIGIDFDNVEVNRGVFPALAGLENLFGLPANSLTLGTTSFESEVEEFDYPVYIAYGLTDTITIGGVIPFINIRRKVRFSISGGNVGFVPGTSTLLPVGIGGVTEPIDTEGVQSLLESPAFGFEFKRLQGFNRTGIGDIRLGLKHQYLRRDHLRLAYSLSLRLPTGMSDDPDDLLDIPFGDGQYDLVLELHNDLLPSKRVLLNLYLRYTLQLPDHKTMRIQTSADEPIAPKDSRDRMKRDLGDYLEAELVAGYSFTRSIGLNIGYYFMYKWRDDIESPTGRDTSSLEDETDKRGDSIRVSLH